VKNVIVVNGSARCERGVTALLLAPFIEGIREAGAEVELIYPIRYHIKPCTGEFHCWYEKPGSCYIKDDMQDLYPELRGADILVLGMPVYIPLPGAMQSFLNRLCPLIEPLLETRRGRTRARLREDVRLSRLALVTVSGWWEKGNCGTAVRVAKELAADMSIRYAGALLRPHGSFILHHGEPTDAGRRVLDAARKAGGELIEKGDFSRAVRREVSRPLVPRGELRTRYNWAYSDSNRPPVKSDQESGT